mmetsp:Transcript_28623/g.55725  ORF Transcript_28623/g.55725 Transcript_28623/m.55725 type:complete len:102 (-) Transcript_28623:402-707(-)
MPEASNPYDLLACRILLYDTTLMFELLPAAVWLAFSKMLIKMLLGQSEGFVTTPDLIKPSEVHRAQFPASDIPGNKYLKVFTMGENIMLKLASSLCSNSVK